VFEVQRFTDGKWKRLFRGDDSERAWKAFEKARPRAPGLVRIIEDGHLVKSVQLFTEPPRPKRKQPLGGVLRRIVKWKGPAASLVTLECGHDVNTSGSKWAPCPRCSRNAVKKER
jgi:hypothetical protein